MEEVTRLTEWMITEGRRSGDPVKVVSQFCSSLVEAGVPLWRVNIGQRFANPLLIAWGVVWTPNGTDSYDVTHETTLTDGYVGSSFEYILANGKPLHKSLHQLDSETEHSSYLEFAEQGGTDYYATLLYYGDGSLHGCTFVTQAPGGFSPEHLRLIEAVLPALSSALEPVTMRKSSKGLLRTYLGDGPSEAVWSGNIKRGERTTLDAVVMFSDLRGFTALSENSTEEEVFETLSDYFDLVVKAVEDNGGDVLKFMGDGILSIFTIEAQKNHADRCRMAALAAQSVLCGLKALNTRRDEFQKPPLDIGIGINVGQVSYGNIGSPGRLDFTVLGGAVNVASRIENLTKSIGQRVLATLAVASAAPNMFVSCGDHEIRGLAQPIELFFLTEGAQ
ncbi:adenylate/guanylate cyclase domain-containing protein [Ruegeria atlantica]|uniref:Adenylate cyclase 1 n=1 Tax=Ruegeria atlantica TaxID=81569 RepID=A0A0P1EF88_9RHOB|nr:adenylate/guanylate cyclase domain-containing protein [Ruegeria atlantica]CUH48720.1 Adenylate cyclase 1 [Ruegeria atlantica]